MANPIDRLFAVDCLKAEVDAAHKQAKFDAEDFLAEMRDGAGTTGLTSPLFGPEAGEYRYGKTKAKKVVEFNLDEEPLLLDWLDGNADAARQYAAANPEAFGRWWFERTGELADGVSRVEYEEPPAVTAPKIYRQDRSVVKEKLARNGGMFEEVSRLLFGDGDAWLQAAEGDA